MIARTCGAFAALLATLLLGSGSVQAEPHLPQRTGAVMDAANIIGSNLEHALATKVADLQSRSNVELLVVTLPSLQGYSIERWGRALGNGWNVGGNAARGVLLVVAPNDRQVRIEIGDGLPMSDSAASSIIDNKILPKFRSGDVPGGILAGVDAITGAIRYPASAEESSWRQFISDINWGVVGFLAIAAVTFLLFVFQTLREARTFRYGYDLATRNHPHGYSSHDDGFFHSHSDSYSSSSSGSNASSSGSSSDGGFSGDGASGRW